MKNSPVIIGCCVWLLTAIFYLPDSPFANSYVHFLLIAAPLWLVPLCYQLLGFRSAIISYSLVAGLAFAGAYFLPQGILAGLLVVPWLLLAVERTVRELLKPFGLSMKSLVRITAFVFLVVGGTWALLDRLGLSVMSFDPIIVLLTAVHFHFAGFLLTILFYFSLEETQFRFLNLIGIGLLSGAPLVAIGITGSQVGLPVLVESLCVSVMALTGIGVGLLHLYLAFKNENLLVKMLWSIAGFCLLCGMTLALLYGWRAHHSLTFLTIPWMYAVHGTLNAVGFAIPALLAWAISKKSEIERRNKLYESKSQ